MCIIKFVENLSRGKEPGFHQVCGKLHDGHITYTDTMTPSQTYVEDITWRREAKI